MRRFAQLLLATSIFAAFALPVVASADTQCGPYTCTGSQVCSADLDGNPMCVTPSSTNVTPTGGNNGTQVTPTGSSGSGLINPLGSNSLWALVSQVLTFVIRIGAIVIVFMLVYVGFKFVTARGEPAGISSARNALLWTIVGALILLGAKAISLGICATAASLSTSGAISCPVF